MYISENDLNTFHYHDCFIKETRTIGDTSIWILDHIDVETSNNLNPNTLAMQTDTATITLYSCKYSNVKRILGVDKIENEKNNDLYLINEEIKHHYFSSLIQDERNKARVDIVHTVYVISFMVEYSRVTIEWNKFIKKSWYEE